MIKRYQFITIAYCGIMQLLTRILVAHDLIVNYLSGLYIVDGCGPKDAFVIYY